MAQPLEEVVTHSSAITEEMVQQAREKILRLAEQQGIKPVQNFDDLLGDFWPEDESIDEFVATVRAWRDEEKLKESPE